MWPTARLDDEVVAEVALDRPRLGRRPRRSRDASVFRSRPRRVTIARPHEVEYSGHAARHPLQPRGDPLGTRVSTGLYRLRAKGRKICRTGASCSRPTTSRASTPGVLGLPLWPKRFLRFMANSELYWWPIKLVLGRRGARSRCAAASATSPRSRRLSASSARATPSRCSRRGRAVRRGSLKRVESRPLLGLCCTHRISSPACRSCRPPSRDGPADAARGGSALAYGAPVAIEDLRGRELSEAAAGSNGSPDGAYRRARGLFVSVLLAVDGDSFAHRAYHGLPKSVRLKRDRRLDEP